MSTSQPGSDATSQATANLRIEELERQLFLANFKANHLKDEKEELEQQLEEDKERRALASYEIEKASRKSEVLEKELAALREQRAAETTAKPKEDSTSKDPKAPKGSLPTYEELKANFIKLKKVAVALDRAHSKLQEEKADQDENVRHLESRLKTSQDTLNAIKTAAKGGVSGFEGVDPLFERLMAVQDEYETALDTDMEKLGQAVSLIQSTFASLTTAKDVRWNNIRQATSKTHRSLSLRESRLIKELDRASQLLEAEDPSLGSSNNRETAPTPEASSDETVEAPATLTTPDHPLANDKSTTKPNETPSAKGKPQDHGKNKLDERTSIPKDKPEIDGGNVSISSHQRHPKIDATGPERAEATDMEVKNLPSLTLLSTKLSHPSESQNDVEKSARNEVDVQGSERVSELEEAMEKAESRYQELEKQHVGLEQRYKELQRINVGVAEENAALTKRIENTLEAFIPKAEKMLHQGPKINKTSQNLLNALVKVVRDGLREP